LSRGDLLTGVDDGDLDELGFGDLVLYDEASVVRENGGKRGKGKKDGGGGEGWTEEGSKGR
jgi:hypothetical protein